ncbi:MAG: PadR family transcriptional regulator [Thermoleophilaceae bacterium]
MAAMALRHAVLAALEEGEASGYELAKRFDVAVANFWHALPQQLYAELTGLERDGLVRGRRVRQAKRPDKRVYRLTHAGTDELHRFIHAPTRPTAIRDELLVKVHAADGPELGAAIAALEERAGYAAAKLERYEALVASILNGRDEAAYLRESPRVGPYLTLARGRAFESENVSWCRWAIGALRAREDEGHTKEDHRWRAP